MISAALLAGCGGSLYEERLEKTRQMFQHMELLDDNLAPAWSDSGISLRVPKQFVPIPAPKGGQKKPAEGESPEVVADDRQPDYVNVELPGLRGAFRAKVAADVEGKRQSLPAYLYVLSNHHLTGDKEKQRSFPIDTVKVLAEALNVEVKEDAWPKEKFPKRPAPFVDVVEYRSAVFTPAQPVNGAPTKFTVYLHQAGDVHIVVLVVAAEGIDPKEKLPEKIDLCLETLRAAGKVATPPKPGEAPKPGAAAAPSAGF